MFRIRLRDLYVRHHGFVRHVCLRYVQNTEDADDLTHDVLLKAAQGSSGFKGECAFTTWLYQVAVNRCRDHMRGHNRRLVGLRRFATATRSGELVSECVSSEGRSADSESRVAKRVLEALLDQYEGAVRHIVLLRFDHGMPHTHISRITGLPRTLVRRRLAQVADKASLLFHDFENASPHTALARKGAP